MKKILILAAVLVVGIAANAASFKWTGANIYGASGSKYTGTVDIYAYDSTKTVNDAVKVTTVYANGGLIVAAEGSSTAGATFEWADADVGSTYNFYMIVEDGGKIFNSSTSDPAVVKSGAAQATSTTSVAFANMTTATYTNASSNWGAVPEPTSGLLMLLGVAGLALRRRRV